MVPRPGLVRLGIRRPGASRARGAAAAPAGADSGAASCGPWAAQVGSWPAAPARPCESHSLFPGCLGYLSGLSSNGRVLWASGKTFLVEDSTQVHQVGKSPPSNSPYETKEAFIHGGGAQVGLIFSHRVLKSLVQRDLARRQRPTLGFCFQVYHRHPRQVDHTKRLGLPDLEKGSVMLAFFYSPKTVGQALRKHFELSKFTKGSLLLANVFLVVHI